MKYLPNTITVIRILLTPFVLYLLVKGTTSSLIWAWVLFIVASISDYVDGKLARTLEVPSRLGQFLDPLADKVLVIGTFIVLAYSYPHLVPWWVVAVIAARDVGVTWLRSTLESRGQTLKTLKVAKTKTAIQLTFLILTLTLLVAAKLPDPVGSFGTGLLGTPILYVMAIVVALVTAATGVVYAFSHDYKPA